MVRDRTQAVDVRADGVQERESESVRRSGSWRTRVRRGVHVVVLGIGTLAGTYSAAPVVVSVLATVAVLVIVIVVLIGTGRRRRDDRGASVGPRRSRRRAGAADRPADALADAGHDDQGVTSGGDAVGSWGSVGTVVTESTLPYESGDQEDDDRVPPLDGDEDGLDRDEDDLGPDEEDLDSEPELWEREGRR